MRKNLPSSAGVCYRRKSDETFSCKLMQTRVGWSLESIHWLDYMQSLPLFAEHRIQHALNIGEKSLTINGQSYKVDGFVQINETLYVFQYDGCAYHQCSCSISKKSVFTKVDDTRRNKDLASVAVLMKMKSCEWKKFTVPPFKSSIATFFNWPRIVEHDILAAVETGEFYGLIQVDISSPQHVIDHFLKLNHPPIFQHIQVEEEMINESFKEILKSRKKKFPLDKQLTLGFNARGYLLTTDLAKFYISKGLKLSNLQLAIEYPRTKPLEKFVNLVTNKRKEATRKRDNNLQQTFKLVMNSSYGRLGLNLENRKKFSYKKIPKQPAADCKSKNINRVTMVNGEFEAQFQEIEKEKTKYTDSVPGELLMIQR